MSDIRQWLEGVGLERYAEAFEENEVTLDLARDLTDTDLEKLGVAILGHRKTLLRAIDKLGEPQPQAEAEPGESAATLDQAGAPPQTEGAAIPASMALICATTNCSRSISRSSLASVLAGIAAPSAVRSVASFFRAVRSLGLKVHIPSLVRSAFMALISRVRSPTRVSRSRLGRLASSSSQLGIVTMLQ